MDAVTRVRAGSLSAHNLSDRQIADTLLLSDEQIRLVRESPEFKAKYAEVAEEVIERQIEMDEGWDAVENKAVAQILQTLEYNRDPKYALFAAKTANLAKRRARHEDPRLTINAAHQETNIIVLNLNKKFVDKVSNEAKTSGIIDITPKQIDTQPRKRVDLPSPAQVENVLSPVRQRLGKDKLLSELEQAFEIAGVFNDDTVLTNE